MGGEKLNLNGTQWQESSLRRLITVNSYYYPPTLQSRVSIFRRTWAQRVFLRRKRAQTTIRRLGLGRTGLLSFSSPALTMPARKGQNDCTWCAVIFHQPCSYVCNQPGFSEPRSCIVSSQMPLASELTPGSVETQADLTLLFSIKACWGKLYKSSCIY